MKSQRLTSVLVGILFFSSICAALMSGWYVISLRSLQIAQPKLAEIRTVTARVQMLINEVMEYRKHNSTIDPLLQSMNLIPRTSPLPPVVPAPKPPVK